MSGPRQGPSPQQRALRKQHGLSEVDPIPAGERHPLTKMVEFRESRPRKPRKPVEPLGYLVGERVYARRKALYMTQARLAHLTGRSQGSIARIETGQAKEVESSTLVVLAHALKVPTDWLLGLLPEDGVETPQVTLRHPRRRVATE